MKIFKEGDSFSLEKAVDGEVIGQKRQIVIPVETIVTVVLVYGDANKPDAYELEAYLAEQDCYALATVEAIAL